MDANFLKEIQTDFYNESLSLIENFESVLLNNNNFTKGQIAELFRIAHSIKGGAAAVELLDVSQFTHKVEDFLAKFRENPNEVNSDVITILLDFSDAIKNKFTAGLNNQEVHWETEHILTKIKNFGVAQDGNTSLAKSTADTLATKPTAVNTNEVKMSDKKGKQPAAQVKIDTNRLESIFETIGEIVVFKNALLKKHGSENSELSDSIEKMDFLINNLYDQSLGLRLTSLQPLFQRMQRTLRDLSVQLNKKVQINIKGDDTEIDRNLFEQLPDPLIHLVRNAIDHGIESADDRAKTAKPATATIELSAYYQSGQVVIEIKDDGKGINPEFIFKKAKDKELIPKDSQITDYKNEEIYNFLFLPGFSTASVVSDLSGRGVGLDVVKTTIEKFHGNITIMSSLGHGTTFKCTMPLTTSLIDGVIFKSGKQEYVVPASSISEIVPIKKHDLKVMSNNNLFLQSSNEPYVAVSMSNYFNKNKDLPENLICVKSIIKEQTVCFLFDTVENLCQAVVKPLPDQQKNTDFIGATMSSEGFPQLILDLNSISEKYYSTHLAS